MKRILLSSLIALTIPAHADIVIYGTRVIYPAEKKEIIVQLMNQSSKASLVQSWIDDGDTTIPPEKISVPFLLTPPVVRIKGNSGQQIKIKKIANALPNDKESIFYFNVLDIPPNTNEENSKNTLKFAMQNRLKLLYRPAGIETVTKTSIKKLALLRSGNNLNFRNDTANWITVPKIESNKIQLNGKTILLPPLSSQLIKLKTNAANQYVVTIIDDRGNYVSDTVRVK
ncbi:fimbria/pilus periplasmic chaperone [Citrobacter cronae]|uniref:fimbria/pilus periplasmic chaperone n=1 Tax=Citrobacter cronae TaxID=1748967 RepID=UPI0021D33428|nr:fimbria/pilus periplasmic chaperone [Citrobacter cronae]MCU6175006.1 fimbria/pilus periplasmic chaperone [Citrobacter cronae]